MKILILLLSATLFLISSSYQEQESPELKEATELSAAVVKLFNQQKFDEALPLAKRVLQIREKLLPRTDPLVAKSLSIVGDLYIAKRDYDAATQTLERLLAIMEERFGPTDLNLAATLDSLAVAYGRDGNTSKAENTYQRAIALREKAFGQESTQVGEPLYALAQFYRYRRVFDRAEATYKRALTIYGRANGSKTPEFDRVRHGLSCLGYESDNKAIFKELELIEKWFAPEEPPREYHDVLNGKALKLAKPGYPEEARDHFLEGTVVVLVDVDETGKVTRARDICQGPPYLSEASVKAALKSRFSPTTLSGTPVKVTGVIQYKYNFVRRK